MILVQHALNGMSVTSKELQKSECRTLKIDRFVWKAADSDIVREKCALAEPYDW